MKNKKLIQVNVVGGVVIKKDGKYLLVQEKKSEVYELWNLPAGKVEQGSTIEETAIKEAKEETGFDVKLLRKVGIYHKNEDKAVKHIFEAKIVGGELNYPKDEILDTKWFSYKEILAMKDKLRNPDCILPALKEVEHKK